MRAAHDHLPWVDALYGSAGLPADGRPGVVRRQRRPRRSRRATAQRTPRAPRSPDGTDRARAPLTQCARRWRDPGTARIAKSDHASSTRRSNTPRRAGDTRARRATRTPRATMKYKDYYAALGVPRDASADAIKSAYRKLARKFHPDVSTEKDAEERFKEIGEAYETLKDAEKRAAYDQLGTHPQGEEFRPPPDWGRGSARAAAMAAPVRSTTSTWAISSPDSAARRMRAHARAFARTRLRGGDPHSVRRGVRRHRARPRPGWRRNRRPGRAAARRRVRSRCAFRAASPTGSDCGCQARAVTACAADRAATSTSTSASTTIRSFASTAPTSTSTFRSRPGRPRSAPRSSCRRPRAASS